ncbi:catalase family protein [Hymenobacter sp. DH14]|uniref:Catalase family protein n=1 Tax=Hymenobacter cyanobacteriorum TaxID=2926463 RepID=A0A9X1VEX9_9BACT|nr:catalase family protein [Hymenobacter cyanobacteriorum]MCI1187681.1 catalase family protein [Hymenobacter cyanobacteriorum]
MPNPTNSYVRYADGVEQIQPNEDQLGDETVASMARVNRFMFEKNRHAIRDAHAKSHGILRGELHIPADLPAHLAQGMFVPGKTYGVIIRLSSAPGAIDPDTQAAVKGCAVKIIGVEGRKFLADQADELTQDFLMVNDTIIPTGDVKSYHDLQLRQEKVILHGPQIAQAIITEAGTLINQALDAVGIKKELPLVAPVHPNNNILGETYTTLGSIRFGDYVAKVGLAPLSANVQALAGQKVDITEPGGWRDLVVDFFKNQGAEYELRAQLCTDLNTMPVEDASIDWPQDQSPYQALGRIVIPAQDAYSPARRVFADDVLSFNPFHCLPEHRPLGSINRVRIKAYESSTAYRHHMNAQPRREPRDISELPD